MPKSQFIVWTDKTGNALVPPMDKMEEMGRKSDLQIVYLDKNGERRGYIACISQVADPNNQVAVVVEIESSNETIEAMKADTNNYTWIKDIEEDNPPFETPIG